MADDPPDYKVYRSRPRFLTRKPEELAPPARPDRPPLEVPSAPRRAPRLPRLSPGRVLRWALIGLAAWLGVSALLFMLSAQIQRGDLADKVGPELDGGPLPPFGATTILVLGSDARPKGLAEPGSGGPSRSDSIMLLRLGAGANASLSIPRDTVVDIPGHGRAKINAAYAFGGAALATRTVKQYLGIEVNHVVEVDFANFADLIDAMGGVTYRGPCVVSKINGGNANGGYTLRLKAGEHELDGRQALALARTRKNECRPGEDDRTRARRQQQLFAAMKDKITSFETFVRLPWVSWAAPKAVRSDMSGPTLLGVVAASLTGGGATQIVLKPSGGVQLPDGGAGLIVSEAEKQRAVERFEAG